jgi:hypothetical protein
VTEQHSFTSEEWRTLQLAPFWMFSAVVGSYGRFDPREYQAFIRCLENAMTAHGGLGGELAASVAADPDQLLRVYGSDGRTIGVGLSQVHSVLQKIASTDAVMVKEMLVTGIAEGIARARGRWGTEMSEEDAKQVALAAELLSYGFATE